MSPEDQSLAIFIVVSVLVVFIGFIALIVSAALSDPNPDNTKKRNSPPIQKFSKIDLSKFIATKVVPRVPKAVPDVPQMSWDLSESFDEEDSHRVVLRLVLSKAEQEIVKKWGLHEDAIETEPLYDQAAVDEVIAAQEGEITSARNDSDKMAALRIEHRHQLEWIKEQEWARTIEYYQQWPYIREFSTRREARAYYDKLDKQILPQLKKRIEEHGNRG